MAHNDLPSLAELERRVTIAEAYRFSPTRAQLDSISISNDDCHTFKETPLCLPTVRNERSAAAVADDHEQIIIKAVEDMETDHVKDHAKLCFHSVSWFDRLTDTILPLIVGRAKPIVQDIRKKTPWDAPFSMSGERLRCEDILTPAENEYWAQELGGKPVINHPPKSSLNDKKPAFGIIWRSRKQEDVDLSPNVLACRIVRERRPPASRKNLLDHSQGLDDGNLSSKKKVPGNIPQSKLATVAEELNPDEEHPSSTMKDNQAEHCLPEGSGSRNPPTHPTNDDALSSPQPDELQITSSQFELKHEDRMRKCLFADVRPAIKIGYFRRHGTRYNEYHPRPSLSNLVWVPKEEEPLAPGAIRCPPSPRGVREDFGFNHRRRHAPRQPLPSSPEESPQTGEMGHASDEDQNQPNEPQLIHFSPDSSPQIAEGSRLPVTRAPDCHRSSPARLPLGQNTIAKVERAPDELNPTDKPRGLCPQHHKVIPRPPAREPLPVVEYTRNPNRHRSEQRRPEKVDISQIAFAMYGSRYPSKQHFPEEFDNSRVPFAMLGSRYPVEQARSPERFDNSRVPFAMLGSRYPFKKNRPEGALVLQFSPSSQAVASSSESDSSLPAPPLPARHLSENSPAQSLSQDPSDNSPPQSLLVSRSVEANSGLSLSFESLLIPDTPIRVIESSPVPASLLVSPSPETVATSQSQPPGLTFPRCRDLSSSSFHAQSTSSKLSLGVSVARKISESRRQRSDGEPEDEDRPRFTWAEKEKWKAVDG